MDTFLAPSNFLNVRFFPFREVTPKNSVQPKWHVSDCQPLIHHGHGRFPLLMDITVVTPAKIAMTIVSARITHVSHAMRF